MPEVVRWRDAHPDAWLFWSTRGIVTVLCDYVEQRGRRHRFALVVLTSATLSPERRARFERLVGGPVASHYRLMECPTIGHDPGGGRFAHHQAHALFMGFTPCTQFKFVQYPDGRMALRLRLREGELP